MTRALTIRSVIVMALTLGHAPVHAQAPDPAEAALEEVIKTGPKTPDRGGTANTTQVGEAIAAAIARG